MNKAIWIRRDRDTGYLMEVDSEYVKNKIEGIYQDTNLAMKHADKENVLSTGFADYYPKEV